MKFVIPVLTAILTFGMSLRADDPKGFAMWRPAN